MLRILLIGLALLSGGAAALLVGNLRPDEPIAALQEPVQGVELVEILVAAQDIAPGTTASPEMFRWQPWPIEALHVSFIRRGDQPDASESFAGQISRGMIIAGSPVPAPNAFGTVQGYLSSRLNPGMRAVAIPVSAERSAGGFILPNNRVDVLMSIPCNRSDDCEGTTSTRTILRNVRVLAIDQVGQDGNEQRSVIGRTATLELTPQDAERIVSAASTGTLALILRPEIEAAEESSVPERVDRAVVIRRGVTVGP
jgi:pilus assembly protein CpaB